MRGAVLTIVAALLGLYGAFGLLLFLGQRSIIYPRHLIGGRVSPPPAPFAVAMIDTADGERLRAWHAPARDRAPTVLHLHGNADTLEGLAPRLRALSDRGYGVLAVAFRGYPGSSGSPSEAGLHADAAAAYDWLARNVADAAIAPYGRSLGSAPALRLAVERPVAAVILEAPFTSALELARKQFPIYPAAILLRDKFRSDLRIGELARPLLVVHGTQDEVIPVEMGERLYQMAPAAPKRLVRIEGGGHNDLDAHGLADIIDRFLTEVLPR